ncbi:acyltransferase [Fibrobacter sp. UWH1]|uniref:acyltransferase n=1 Tax=Fibrobacter sp. UWH1 TaxID=1964354 RepID=UPI001595C674|nr:acyltransferase [Fibrobacter sp. UWH1]
MECKGVCRIGMIKFNRTNYGGPDHPGGGLAINNWGTVVFHGPCEIHTGVKINVFRFATLDLGSQCHIMPNCNVTANGLVVIGNNTRLAHRSQIMDSNYHFIADVKNKTVRNIHCPIYIGDCVWICNSVTVSAGAKIPSHTIVSSGSLVNKDFSNIPESSIIGGCPAKLLKSDCRRIYNQSLESTIRKWFRENPEEKIYRLGDCFDPMECD